MENETETLAYWKNNAEEDYMTTPISVLRYITEMEKALDTSSVVGRSDQLVLFSRFISNNSKLTGWMTSKELLEEFKKQS